MRVILAANVQIVILVLIGLFNYISRRKRLLEYSYNSIFLTTRYIMGCNITCEQLALKDRVLVICNHPTILDFIYLMHWAKAQNRLKDIRFVSKDSIGNIPGIGKYVKQSQCLISRDFEKDYSQIINFCQKLSHKAKYILVIFPEGTTICPESKEKSINFSKSNQKPFFKKTLYPRHRGLELILKHLLIEQFLDLTLFYNDDRNCYKCNYDIDILFDSYPRNGVIVAKELELSSVSVKTVSTILEKSWIEKEKFLKGLSG
jgi:1-acyl-sn-glycerol-3-phosphate acyltransferase